MTPESEPTSSSSSGGPAGTGPIETFEEALALAIRSLAESATGIPDEWLAALDREKAKG
jgi:hypothetical protein